MDIEELKQRVFAQPFEPFEIHVSGGRVLPIAIPSRVAPSPSGSTIAIRHESGKVEILELELIEAIGICNEGAATPLLPTCRE